VPKVPKRVLLEVASEARRCQASTVKSTLDGSVGTSTRPPEKVAEVSGSPLSAPGAPRVTLPS
jgi:hypothetical protein